MSFLNITASKISSTYISASTNSLLGYLAIQRYLLNRHLIKPRLYSPFLQVSNQLQADYFKLYSERRSQQTLFNLFTSPNLQRYSIYIISFNLALRTTRIILIQLYLRLKQATRASRILVVLYLTVPINVLSQSISLR